jgi:hypothetical protein
MAEANPEVEFHLDGFLEQCNEMLNEHYDSKFDGKLDAPEIKVYPGSKYYKISKKEQRSSAESVWFFIDKEEGNIWKAASWKAPARNFPRGNILTDNAKDIIGVYGL